MLAIATLRPGLTVSAFDASLRAHLAGVGLSYPHHSGHGIGTSVHEWPRMVPDEGAMIEENIVLMVEPGAYVAGVGGALRTHAARHRHWGGSADRFRDERSSVTPRLWGAEDGSRYPDAPH